MNDIYEWAERNGIRKCVRVNDIVCLCEESSLLLTRDTKLVLHLRFGVKVEIECGDADMMKEEYKYIRDIMMRGVVS